MLFGITYKTNIMKELTLEDLMPFGKYKFLPLKEICLHERDYIEWCLKNIEWFKIDKKAKEFLLDCRSKRSDHLWSWLGTEDAPNLSPGDLC